jgi:hypothetical protein
VKGGKTFSEKIISLFFHSDVNNGKIANLIFQYNYLLKGTKIVFNILPYNNILTTVPQA